MRASTTHMNAQIDRKQEEGGKKADILVYEKRQRAIKAVGNCDV